MVNIIKFRKGGLFLLEIDNSHKEEVAIKYAGYIEDLSINKSIYVGDLSIVDIEELERYMKKLGYSVKNQAYEYFILNQDPAAKLNGDILKIKLEDNFLEEVQGKTPILEYEKNKIIIKFT